MISQNRPLRFLLAGILNSLFGFLIYGLVIVLFDKVWLALLAGICAGIVFNFLTTGGFVFRDTSLERVPRFVLCYLLIYAANYLLITILINWVDSAILAQALLTPFVAVFSYLLMARFVFHGSTDQR